jgi:hypothetical protein
LKASEHGVVSGLKLVLPGSDPAQRAEAFIDRYRESFLPGDAQSDVRVQRVVPGPYGPVVQMKQNLDGLPVYGSTLVVSEDRLHRIRLAVSSLSPLGLIERHEELASASVAVRSALTAFREGNGIARGEPRVETVWFRQGDHLCKIHLVTILGADPLGEFTYLVGGPDAKVAFGFRRTPMVQGYAYPSNPLRDETYQLVDLPFLTSAEHLAGEHVEVFNCTGSSDDLRCDNQQHLALPDADGNYLIEPVGANDPALPDDAFVEVQAYYGINLIYDYFVGVGFTSDFVYVGVNYRMPELEGPNAMYLENDPDFDGPVVLMGQWSDQDTAVDLGADNDVIFHEYGHHIFAQMTTSGLFFMDEHGPVTHGTAMNEATADYYSCSALDDPDLGEYLASLMPESFPSGFLRSVDNSLTCPRGLYGEPHIDSMIWSGFLWEMRIRLGQPQADSFFLDVLAHFPGRPNFATVTEVYLARAETAFDPADLEYAQTIAHQRSLPGCERFIPLEDGQHTGFIFGKGRIPGLTDQLNYMPGEVHYYFEIPDDAHEIEVQFDAAVHKDGGSVDMLLLVREDQRIEHQLNMAEGGFESEYDFELESGGTFDLRIIDPAAPFRAGHTYNFEAVNRDFSDGEYTINIQVIEIAPEGGDGCACGTRSAGGLVLLLVFAGLALMLKRRRTCSLLNVK